MGNEEKNFIYFFTKKPLQEQTQGSKSREQEVNLYLRIEKIDLTDPKDP
jgi:hypothetical protein